MITFIDKKGEKQGGIYVAGGTLKEELKILDQMNKDILKLVEKVKNKKEDINDKNYK